MFNERLTLKKSQKISAALIMCAFLSACASSSNRVTVQESTKISKGQKLSDLLRAFNEKAITESEYLKLRKIIMQRPQ